MYDKDSDPERWRYDSYKNQYDIDRSFAANAATLSETDKDLIRKFLSYKNATKKLSKERQKKLWTTLVSWRRHLPKNFDELQDIEDIHEGINRLYSSRSIIHRRAKGTAKSMVRIEGEKLSEETIHDHVVILKMFLMWFSERTSGIKLPIPPEIIRKQIKAPTRPKKKKMEEDCLTVEDVRRMLSVTSSMRDKALLAFLFDTGCRAGELARCRWKDVIFDSYGASVRIKDEKNNQERYARIIPAAEYLNMYRNGHFDSSIDPEKNWIFQSPDGGQIKYPVMSKAFKKALTRAGITKKHSLHSMRHAKVTSMQKEGYVDAVIKEMIWGNQTTRMYERYSHIGQKAIDNEVFRHNGIETEETKSANTPLMVPCPHCGTRNLNEDSVHYCKKCGTPLSAEAKAECEAIRKIAEADPRYKAAMRAVFGLTESQG